MAAKKAPAKKPAKKAPAKKKIAKKKPAAKRPAARRPTPKKADVVPPDPAHGPTEPSSKFWGVTWSKRLRRWRADYTDANGKRCYIGLFDTQEPAAHAVNAAIRALPPDVQRRRKTNPFVDDDETLDDMRDRAAAAQAA